MSRPLFTISAGLRLTDATVYLALVAQYQFGSPVIIGVAPNALAAATGATVVTDATYDQFNTLPGLFLNSSLMTLLGQAISPAVGSGTLTGVTYTDANGVRWTSVDWEWTISVDFYAIGVSQGSWDQQIVTWTGDGVNGRLIPTTIDLTQGIVVVWVFPQTAGTTYRHTGMTASNTTQFRDPTKGITGFTATGFTVVDDTGNNCRVNVAGSLYTALIFRDTTIDQRFLHVGSYAGSGLARTITCTITPTLVWIFGRTNAGAHKSELHPPATSRAWSTEVKLLTDEITSFNATSFNIADDNNVNAAGLTYFWFALANPPGSALRAFINTFTLIGNGGVQTVTGIGFLPGFAGAAQYLGTPTAQGALWRGPWNAALSSQTFAGVAETTLGIEGFGSGTIQINTDLATLSTTVYGVAVKSSGTLTFAVYAPAPPPVTTPPIVGGPNTLPIPPGSGGSGCGNSIGPNA